MNGDIVAPVVDLVQVKDMRDLSVEVPRRVYRYIGIVAVNFHAQLYCHVGHAHTDRAKTDDPQSLARELCSGKLLLLFLGRLRNVLVVPVRADPVNAFHYIAGCEKHSCKDHLLHAVGVCTGRIKNNDALSGTAVHGNVVDACAGSRDREQLRREFHVVHRRTSYQNSLRLREILRPLILRRERLQALFRNVVETCVFEHQSCPFSDLYDYTPVSYTINDVFYNDLLYGTIHEFCRRFGRGGASGLGVSLSKTSQSDPLRARSKFFHGH